MECCRRALYPAEADIWPLTPSMSSSPGRCIRFLRIGRADRGPSSVTDGVSPTVVMSGLPDDGELGAVHLRAGINVEGACELFSQTTSKHWRQVRLSTKQMKFLTRADVSLRQEIRSTTSTSLERIYTMKTMKRIRQGVASMALCAAVIGAPLALAPAANAVTGCNFWAGTDNRAYAQCSGGSGYVRAGARCKTWYGGQVTAYGAWVRAGQVSVANCGWPGFVWGAHGPIVWFETKS